MSRSINDRNLHQQNSQNQPLTQSSEDHQQQPPATVLPQIVKLPAGSGSYIVIKNISKSHDEPVRISADSVMQIGGEPSVLGFTTHATSSTSQLDTLSPVLKKRPKLEVTDSSSSCGSTNITDDLTALKSRISEQKHQRLTALVDRHNEHVLELYFLQSNGNMMEYPTWRKKLPTPQFLSFKRNHRLDLTSLDDGDLMQTCNRQLLPEGAEIKIAGVGSTPIAVSTQLPAAVVQLSQKGQIPGKPQGGRHGMVFGQISNSSTVGNSPQKPLVPGGTPIVPDQKRILPVSLMAGHTKMGSNSSLNLSSPAVLSTHQQLNSADQISVKAKEEVHVLQRVQELKREGLWMGTRLPKQAEPPRIKVHWDFLLEEMQWLATDFANERKWKKASAKKCARMVQKYFQDKEMATLKAEKAQEQNLKRIAAFVAKEVKNFWASVEKVVEIKQTAKLEAKRKKALNEKLNFIVDQTEKYSLQVAEGMNKATTATASKATSLNSSRKSSPHPEDDEWSRPEEDSDDDEETIAQAEADLPMSSTNDEIEALKKESEMDLNDFLKTLPKNYLQNRDKIDEEMETESLSDKEFETQDSEEDDEDTIMQQEKAERNIDHKAEIDQLKAENEMSIDELKAKYSKLPPPAELDSDDESEPEESSMSDDDEPMDVDSEEEAEDESADENEETEEVGLENLLVTQQEGASGSKSSEQGDDILNDVAALAQSIQPKGNTLMTANVVTPIPILLKHTLREYQHIGLDWLVTMHDRKLNGILADEMGLGKTIQTIALLAHLACVRENWGPHLIVVPSSVMLNWEMEFKKWCPGFKIMTYYGSQKERKIKRTGWTKPNAFHVCITSYKLVIQDHQSFRRKKWKYLILDEAQNIKNFKSQRWQLLLNFVTERRLLLTGTPLQNNMMELWSLMHFLMPNFFESHRAFEELFSKPMTGMVEGNVEYNENIILKLHKVLRPFLLRRLKSEVEKQMPQKYEHVIMCRLSKRQRYLYDDFMSRAKTKETLASGNLLSVINVLMQLRKVCNHPNLFEVRPTVSPFRMDQIDLKVPAMLYNIVEYDPLRHIDLVALNLVLVQLEDHLSAFVAYRMKQLMTPKTLIEEIDSTQELPPICPPGKCKIHLRIKPQIQRTVIGNFSQQIKVGASPVIKAQGNIQLVLNDDKQTGAKNMPIHQLIQTASGQLYLQKAVISQTQPAARINQSLATAVIDAVRTAPVVDTPASEVKAEASEFQVADIEEVQREYRHHILSLLSKSNRRKCDAKPMYGIDVRHALQMQSFDDNDEVPFIARSFATCSQAAVADSDWSLAKSLKTIEQRTEDLHDIFSKFTIFVPAVSSEPPSLSVSHMHPSQRQREDRQVNIITREVAPKTALLHPIASAMTTQFPDPRLIQYDCGKLQSLDYLLRELKSGSHRVLIFTQMTKMLDVLEAFLNYHGHIYLRLDGTTKVENRQHLMERFNEDKRVFVFILSTRSGGVGINLTGADTVIFYDSDWNPTCDAQAQDRCHRIGQTRDVHIYRLISEKTIEENILKKANQKRLLGDLAIEGGNFTEAYFKNSTIQDLFNVDQSEDASARLKDVVDRDAEKRAAATSDSSDKSRVGAFESALAQAEDDQDVQAAKTATAEMDDDLAEFDENIPITEEPETEQTKQEKEIQCLVDQLSPIERYAMKFVEETGANWAVAQLKVVEMEIEQTKREWEEKRLAERKLEEAARSLAEKEESEILTYSREDALNKVWISSNSSEEMPMWCPPTPPQEGNDVYVDHSLSFLYDLNSPMDEVQLPAVYVRKEYKRMRTDDDFFMDGRRAIKMRKDDGFTAPRSLFDRPTPAIIKMRKDLKLQRNRGLMRSMPMVNIKQHNPMKPLTEPEGMAEWLIFEDRAILNVVQNLQGLPLNLMVISPGHTPNWDLVAEIVNQSSRTYRSPKQCRWRYEAVIVPREEGKLIDSPKRQKKTKNLLKTAMKNSRSPRTSTLYQHDNNGSFNKLAKMKFDAIKTAMMKKQPQMRKYMNNVPLNKNHAPLLTEYGIAAYDFPLSPLDIAHRCYERLIQDRNMAQQKIEQQVKMQTKPPLIGASQLMNEQLSPIHQSPSPIQQVSNQIQVTPMQTTIVVQPNQAGGQQHQTAAGQQSMTALIHGSSLQGQRIQTQTINLTPSQGNSPQQQMMKAIVASPGGTHQQALLTGIIQQINPNQIQPQSNLIQTSSVSVVLTSPPSTVTSVQPQIVSIQPTISTSTPIVTQGVQSIVQTLNQQNAGQIVSVSQLSLGSTSLSQGVTIAGQPGQIRQRSGFSKEVLLQHRPGTTNPTVISLSGLTGPGLSQLTNATLRLTSNFNQSNLRTAVTGDKQQIIGQSGKRFELVTGTPFHFYGGQPQVRQKLRFLHTGQITTSPSQTTLVPSSAMGTVQVQSGQKITVATINPSTVSSQQQGSQQIVGQSDAVDSSQASPVSVQVGPHQRAQFVKQVATSQALGQGTNQKIVMVKHELPQQYKGGQLQLSQTQLAYAPSGSIQIPGASGSPQIATLIKTSGASGITTVSNAGPMAMKLSPVRASLAQQQGGVRQVAIPQAMTMGLQSQRKAAPKVTRIAHVGRSGIILQQKEEVPGKFTLQEVKPMGKAQPNQIFLSNQGNVIPVSQATTSRGETLQFVTPTSRGVPSGNIRFQPSMKIISGNDNPQTIALSQVVAQRRLQSVSVQKPQTITQQTAGDNSGAGTSQSPSGSTQQSTTPPQHSPQMK